MENDLKYRIRALEHDLATQELELEQMKSRNRAACSHSSSYKKRNYDSQKSEFTFELYCNQCDRLLSRRQFPFCPDPVFPKT